MENRNWKFVITVPIARLIGVLFLIFGMQSCKEIIATDISETVPVLILPQVNDTMQDNPVHFKWEEVEGATKYHLEVVSPSFDNIQEYTIDSLVTGTSIFISLDSNEYELRLTAVNEGYRSHTLGPVRFWVGVQPSQSSSSVTLSSPAQDVYFNEDFNGVFSWLTLADATSYEYSLRKGTSYASPNIIETVSGIVTNSYTSGTLLAEGEYHWGVKAYFSSGAETLVSTRRFYIDTINPVAASLVSPSGNVSPGTVTFTWTNGSDPGTVHSPVFSTIEVAEDSNFTLNLQSESFSGTSGSLTLSGTGTRYWRVINIDEAGNSTSSVTGQFTLF